MEEIRIGRDDAGQRLDQFLRKYLAGASLPTIFKLIRTKQVTVNRKRARPERRLEEGDQVILHPADRRLEELRGAKRTARRSPPRNLEVLHEDEHVLAVHKPAFLLVHPGRESGEPTLIDGVLDYLGTGSALTFEPALAHRLDRQTSGVVLIGKSAAGLRGLTEALKRGEVKKRYLALAVGEPEEDEGRVSAPLLRKELFGSDRPRVAVDVARGQRAETAYRVAERRRGLGLIEARPLTGRTHQIRVHLRHIGHPIVGDATYGDRGINRVMRGRYSLWRQWLHALEIEFDHPVSGERTSITSPLPGELKRVLDGEGFACPWPHKA